MQFKMVKCNRLILGYSPSGTGIGWIWSYPCYKSYKWATDTQQISSVLHIYLIKMNVGCIDLDMALAGAGGLEYKPQLALKQALQA